MNVQPVAYYPNNQVQYVTTTNQMAVGIPVNYTYSQPQVQIIAALPQQQVIFTQDQYKPPLHSRFYCNLITVIVFSCLNPWMCTSLAKAKGGVVIAMIIIHLITSGLQISGAAIGIGLNDKDPGLRTKRILIFVFMIIGASWNVIAIIIWLAYLIVLKRGAYDDFTIFGPILYVISVVLFCFDIGFKAPLISNCIIVAVRSWDVLGKAIATAAISHNAQQISQEANNIRTVSPVEYPSPVQNSKL